MAYSLDGEVDESMAHGHRAASSIASRMPSLQTAAPCIQFGHKVASGLDLALYFLKHQAIAAMREPT
jgi:hypothetical protein